MSAMLQGLVGLALSLALCVVMVAGLRARRTRLLSALGLVPASGACVAFATVLLGLDRIEIARYAFSLAAWALGFAHAVVFSLTAMPRGAIVFRGVLVGTGLWAGCFAGLWLGTSERFATLEVLVVVLGLLTLATWIALPFLSKEPGVARHGSIEVPSVRFPCPRCGTHVDWGRGVAACTDCGLFLHISWPAVAPKAGAKPDPAGVPRSVRFSCPSCATRNTWHTGLGVCPRCGLRLSLHWNVHTNGR